MQIEVVSLNSYTIQKNERTKGTGMKKFFTKKIIVTLMTVIMVVTSVPFVSFAVENGEEAPATNEQSVQESEEAESSIQNKDAKRGAQEEGADSDSQNVITRKGVQAAS